MVITVAASPPGYSSSVPPDVILEATLAGHIRSATAPLVHMPSTSHEATLGHSCGPGTLSALVSSIATGAAGACTIRTVPAPFVYCMPEVTTTAHLTSSVVIVASTGTVSSRHCLLK